MAALDQALAILLDAHTNGSVDVDFSEQPAAELTDLLEGFMAVSAFLMLQVADLAGCSPDRVIAQLAANVRD